MQGLDDLLEVGLKEFPMLDIGLEDNAVVRPLIAQASGEAQGVLLDLTRGKFGPLPA